jgi:hypothetical protein
MAHPQIFARYIVENNLRLLGIMLQALNAEIQEWKCSVFE